jgi:hypothetical protein
MNRHLVLGTYPSRKVVDELHDFALRALRPADSHTAPTARNRSRGDHRTRS